LFIVPSMRLSKNQHTLRLGRVIENTKQRYVINRELPNSVNIVTIGIFPNF
jgi:hypothetical protein